MRIRHSATLLACVLLAACGGDKTNGNGAGGDDGLPKPDAVSGSVTGMPDPGTAAPQPAAIAQAPTDADLPANIELPEEDAPATDGEPGADAAVAVIRDYYAAINGRDYARALALWQQPPQSLQQFADGFAGTAGVSVQVGAPGPIDAGAGQRNIEIPVTLDATQADGRVDRYAGSYVLHRSVVEGGNPEWRIARAQLTRQ